MTAATGRRRQSPNSGSSHGAAGFGRALRRILFAVLIAPALLTGYGAAQAQPSEAVPGAGTARDAIDKARAAGAQRIQFYCSITVGEERTGWLNFGYNLVDYETLPERPCSQARFELLDRVSVLTGLKTVGANPVNLVINGSYRLMMDRSVRQVLDRWHSIGEFRMAPMATLSTGVLAYWWGRLTGDEDMVARPGGYVEYLRRFREPYTPYVRRSIVEYLWEPGTPHGMLTAPDGKRYVLVALSVDQLPGMTPANLDTLGPLLRLPAGWRFDHVVSDKIFAVRTLAPQHTARLLVDDFDNRYIEIP